MSVSPYNAVYHRGLAGLCVAVVGSDRVGFDIFGVVDLHETFVDVAASGFGDGSWHIEIGDVVRTLVPNLPKELSGAATSAAGKVYNNVVILAAGWLLHEGLLQQGTIDAQDVAVVDQLNGAWRSLLVGVDGLQTYARNILDVLDHFGVEDLWSAVPTDLKPFGRADLDFIQQSEADTPIPKDLLHGHIVDAKWLPRFDVGNGLLQRETI